MKAHLAYFVWQLAQQKYNQSPLGLKPHEIERLTQLAEQAITLQQNVLDTNKTDLQLITIDIKKKHLSTQDSPNTELDAWLYQQGISHDAFQIAAHDELYFDHLVQQHVRAKMTQNPITEAQLLDYYHAHRTQFMQPEQRLTWHLLVTINPDYPDNQERQVRTRMQHWQQLLSQHPEKFAIIAERYSECPSALQQGKMGWISQGTLLPELDKALFQLPKPSLSDCIESHLGMHLLWCEAIRPAAQLQFAQIKTRLHQHLSEKQQQRLQGAFIQSCQLARNRDKIYL